MMVKIPNREIVILSIGVKEIIFISFLCTYFTTIADDILPEGYGFLPYPDIPRIRFGSIPEFILTIFLQYWQAQ